MDAHRYSMFDDLKGWFGLVYGCPTIEHDLIGRLCTNVLEFGEADIQPIKSQEDEYTQVNEGATDICLRKC